MPETHASTRTARMPRTHCAGALALCQPMALLAAALVLIVPATPARADGKFFRRAVGAEADPTIPFQRAVIAYHDGVETLIVESAVEAGGDQLGWVIPLPAEPPEVAACKPGVLRSMYRIVGPRIKTPNQRALYGSNLWFWATFLICAVIALHHHKGRLAWGHTVLGVLVLLSGLFVLAILLLPNLGRTREIARGVDAGGVEILQHRQVGAYDVTVITGQDGEPIRTWLTEHGFHVPGAAETVLNDYAEKGWCFVAARIAAAPPGTVTPHPLRFTFPTNTAVYPMKLTGVGAQQMQLDLYVIGDEAASVPHLDRWSSDRYQRNLPAPLSSSRRFDGWHALLRAYRKQRNEVQGHREAEATEPFTAEAVGLSIGHPDVTALMWPGCTLTHLRGELRPRHMVEDLSVHWRDADPYRRTAYTTAAARTLGHTVVGSLGGLALLIITAAWCRFGRQKQKRWLIVVAASLVISVGAGLATAALVPRIQTGSVSTGIRGISTLLGGYAELLREGPEDYQPGDDLGAAWAKVLEEWSEPMRIPDSAALARDVPGGYEIEKSAAGWTVTIYDEHATPIRFHVDPDGRATPRSPATTQPAESPAA